jgi:ATP-dependent Clp protease adaptor protein ClpS
MVIDDEESEGEVVVQASRPKPKQPPRFAVLLHNDDYTTMEFVIEILKRIFHKSEEEAVQVMLKVHQQGKGIAGIYEIEIAETKVNQVHEQARSRGFPLLCSVEPIE